MAQGVFVITEQRDGVFRKVSFEAVSEGRRIADGLGADLTAVVVGSGIEGIAGELEKYGPDKILVADDPALADYTTDAYTNVIAELVQSVGSGGDSHRCLCPGQRSLCAVGRQTGCRSWPWTARRSNWIMAILTCTRPMFGGKDFCRC